MPGGEYTGIQHPGLFRHRLRLCHSPMLLLRLELRYQCQQRPDAVDDVALHQNVRRPSTVVARNSTEPHRRTHHTL